MASSPDTDQHRYVLGHSDAELRRLAQQAAIYGPVTRLLLQSAGLRTGMKVLDVGTGVGDVAFALAEIVGATGMVVGIDTSSEAIATARSRTPPELGERVLFTLANLHSSNIDRDFDAVVGRFVLMHQRDVLTALRAVVDHVRPGGIVAFAEGDVATALRYAKSRPVGLVRSTWDWTDELFRKAGMSVDMTTILRAAFVQVGLQEPSMFVHAPLGCGADWPGFDMDAQGMRSILPELEKHGIVTVAELGGDTLAERYRAETAASGYPFMLMPVVAAWSRK